MSLGHDKVFDIVDLPTLVKAAERHEFPIEMLHLALDMHTAPRRLARQKTIGPAIQPGRSVLAGCGLAIPFVRMYLHTDMGALIVDLQILHWRDPQDLPGILSRVTCSVHVDDVSQLA